VFQVCPSANRKLPEINPEIPNHLTCWDRDPLLSHGAIGDVITNQSFVSLHRIASMREEPSFDGPSHEKEQEVRTMHCKANVLPYMYIMGRRL
jgi:hypothetical protein